VVKIIATIFKGFKPLKFSHATSIESRISALCLQVAITLVFKLGLACSTERPTISLFDKLQYLNLWSLLSLKSLPCVTGFSVPVFNVHTK